MILKLLRFKQCKWASVETIVKQKLLIPNLWFDVKKIEHYTIVFV